MMLFVQHASRLRCTKNQNIMKKIILTFGLIAGLICGGMFFIGHPSDGQMDFENGMLYIKVGISVY